MEVKSRQSLEKTLDAIANATLSIIQKEDLNQILQQITNVCRTTINAKFAAMGIYDEHDTLIEFVVSGSSTNGSFPRASKDLLGTIMDIGIIRIAHVDQANSQIDFPPNFPLPYTFLGASIHTEDKTSGALYLTDKENGTPFDELDEKVVEILAAHAAVAIRKAILRKARNKNHQEIEKRNSQLAALNQAAMTIVGELALDKVLQQIVDSARQLVNAKYAALGVPNSDGYLEAFIHSGMNDEDAQKIEHQPKGFGLLGAIYTELKPIRIPKVSADKRAIGFPDNHPPMESFLGVPVIAGQEMLGNLYLTNKLNADEFSLEDQKLVELFAAHAAIAIQNAHLYEQVGRLAIVEERTRIGMDLHDGIIQSIYAVGLTLESTRLALPENATESDKMLEMAINGLNETIRDIRNFILDLRPHRFSGNLHQGISRLIREFQANTMVLVTFKANDDIFDNLPTSIARAIFLTTQEALANVARHARASEAIISVERNTSQITVTIKDDGQGFDMQKSRTRIGHGLSNMQARMEELRGKFEIDSAPGKGAAIILMLPLQ